MNPTSVLIIDDHPVVRRGLRRYFELLPDIDIVGEASGGPEGLILAEQLRPDVILLDLSMPEMSGFEVAQALGELLPGTPVLIFTSSCRTEEVLGALRAGAAGYLLKDSSVDELALAIRSAMSGQPYLTPLAARTLISDTLAEPAPGPRLTNRERAVYELVGRGMSNRDIAAELGMSEKTTSVHLSNLMAKLGLRSRTQVAVHALSTRK